MRNVFFSHSSHQLLLAARYLSLGGSVLYVSGTGRNKVLSMSLETSIRFWRISFTKFFTSYFGAFAAPLICPTTHAPRRNVRGMLARALPGCYCAVVSQPPNQPNQPNYVCLWNFLRFFLSYSMFIYFINDVVRPSLPSAREGEKFTLS